MSQRHNNERESPRWRGLTAAAGLAVAAALAPPVAAEPIAYTLQGTNLARVDLATLDVETVGPAGDDFTLWLAFHADGTLYGLDRVGLDALILVTYDLVTGAAQQVAEIDLDGLAFEIRGFAGDACGGLWAVGTYLVADGGQQPALLPIDAKTGTAGAPVDLQPVEPSEPADVLGLAPFGNVLLGIGAGGLEAIDPKSGATVSLFPDAPVVIHGMDVGPDGALWTLELVPVGGVPTFLHRMDLATGEITDPGGVFGIVGLAIAPPGGACGGAGPAPIPTLSPLALVALAGLLAAVGMLVARRSGLAGRGPGTAG